MGLLLLSPSIPVIPQSGPPGTLLALEMEAGTRHIRSFKTDTMISWAGNENRVARWLQARETLETTVLLDDEQDMRILRRLRAFNPIDVYYVPIRWESVPLTVNATGASITVDGTLADWLVPGQLVLVEDPSAAGYTAVVQSTLGSGTATVVSLDVSATGGSYRAGIAQVAPLRPFYLEDQSPVGRYQVTAGKWTVTMRSVVPEPTPVSGSPATLTIYDTRVLVDRRPVSLGSDAEDRPDSDVTTHELGGILTPEVSRTVANIYRNFRFHVGGYADRQYWRLLHATLKGSQVACYLPTWRDDLPVSGVAGSTLTVTDGGEYATAWRDPAEYRTHVQIEFTSGVVAQYDTISATVVGGNSQVVLDTDISAMGSIRVASMLELVRLATDDLEFTVGVSGNATLQLGFVVVH